MDSFSPSDPPLSREARGTLLGVARGAVEAGAREGRAPAVDAGDYGAELRPLRASFVTLRRGGGRLRGCTGSLEAERPLVVDVSRNAFRSANFDPRFEAVTQDELADLEIEISILSRLEPLDVESEAALLARLRPGVDGLVLRDGDALGTFLPAVWESLPVPERFLAELKRKAGLPDDHWSPTLRVERYTVEEFR